MVLQEGVIEGRKVFGNITKYIKMGASSNFGNMFSVLGASIFLPFLPMAPIQVLTNNLLYDFSQTAIPTDNVDEEYLAMPRKWDIGNIFKFMIFIGPISSIFDYATFFTMLYVFNAWNNPSLFQTGWFVESLLTQTLIIHIIRTAKIPFLQSRASAPLMITSLLICVVGIALPHIPWARAGACISPNCRGSTGPSSAASCFPTQSSRISSKAGLSGAGACSSASAAFRSDVARLDNRGPQMKTQILAAIGERELQPAARLNAALAANDRLKYAFSLLQMALAHAEHPEQSGADAEA